MLKSPVILAVGLDAETVPEMALVAEALTPGAQLLQVPNIHEAHRAGGRRHLDIVVFDHPVNEVLMDFVRDLRTGNPRVILLLLHGTGPSHPQEQTARLQGIHFLSKPLNRILATNLLRALLRASAPHSGETFMAMLRNLHLLDVLQLKCQSGASCLLEIVGNSDRNGYLVLSEGHILHAAAADARGEDAVYEMVLWQGGRIVERDCPLQILPTVKKNWQEVLIEAARLLDEKIMTSAAPLDGNSSKGSSEPRVLGPEDLVHESDPDFIACRKILVVDDSPMLLRYLEGALGIGFPKHALMTVETGQEGLHYARQYPPEVIVLDFVLPDFNGDAFCSRLREVPELAKVPVILMSGMRLDLEQIKKNHVNVTGWLSKPFSTEDLMAEMQKVLKPDPAEAAA